MNNKEVIKEMEENYGFKIPTFWDGFGNALNIFPEELEISPKDDFEAIKSDWDMTGEDIDFVLQNNHKFK